MPGVSARSGFGSPRAVSRPPLGPAAQVTVLPRGSWENEAHACSWGCQDLLSLRSLLHGGPRPGTRVRAAFLSRLSPCGPASRLPAPGPARLGPRLAHRNLHTELGQHLREPGRRLAPHPQGRARAGARRQPVQPPRCVALLRGFLPSGPGSPGRRWLPWLNHPSAARHRQDPGLLSVSSLERRRDACVCTGRSHPSEAGEESPGPKPRPASGSP